MNMERICGVDDRRESVTLDLKVLLQVQSFWHVPVNVVDQGHCSALCLGEVGLASTIKGSDCTWKQGEEDSTQKKCQQRDKLEGEYIYSFL